MAKKNMEEQRKAEEKNTPLMKKMKVFATVTMKEISLATKDRT